jgi:hypothetical protein
VVRLVGVAQTSQHVCDRVSHRHVFTCFLPWFPSADLRRSVRVVYQLDLVTPGSSPRCAISRRQIRHRPNLR